MVDDHPEGVGQFRQVMLVAGPVGDHGRQRRRLVVALHGQEAAGLPDLQVQAGLLVRRQIGRAGEEQRGLLEAAGPASVDGVLLQPLGAALVTRVVGDAAGVSHGNHRPTHYRGWP